MHIYSEFLQDYMVDSFGYTKKVSQIMISELRLGVELLENYGLMNYHNF